MRSIARLLVSLISMGFGAAYAGELAGYAGGLRAGPPSESTYSWALEYRQAFAQRWSGSFTWLNEGHIVGHHRDGHAVQVWWHAPGSPGPAFRLGLGPYHFYDTRTASNSRAYVAAHGWGLLASAEAIWPLNDSWFASLRANRIQTRGDGNSTALLAGIGYSFAPVAGGADIGYRSAAARPFEVNALIGKAIVNSFSSESDTAAAIGLRYRAARSITGSLSYMDEGEGRQEPRQGYAAQFWLEDNVARRLSVGAGIGPYFLVDRARRTDGTTPSRVAGMVSITGAYAITDALAARLIWNRVVTRDDSDSDVVLLGMGFRF